MQLADPKLDLLLADKIWRKLSHLQSTILNVMTSLQRACLFKSAIGDAHNKNSLWAYAIQERSCADMVIAYCFECKKMNHWQSYCPSLHWQYELTDGFTSKCCSPDCWSTSELWLCACQDPRADILHFYEEDHGIQFCHVNRHGHQGLEITLTLSN